MSTSAGYGRSLHLRSKIKPLYPISIIFSYKRLYFFSYNVICIRNYLWISVLFYHVTDSSPCMDGPVNILLGVILQHLARLINVWSIIRPVSLNSFNPVSNLLIILKQICADLRVTPYGVEIVPQFSSWHYVYVILKHHETDHSRDV